MIDSKIFMSWVLRTANHFAWDEMLLSGSFQIAVIMENLPLLWKDFKNYLKYKYKEMWLASNNCEIQDWRQQSNFSQKS